MSKKIKWTNQLVLEFIELYKNERALWDPTNPHYKCKTSDETAMAWNRIRSYSRFNNCCVKELKKKKESLMTLFRSHMYKKRENPSYHTFWFAFSALESFLGSRYESESSNQSEEDSSSQDYQVESDESNDDETSLITSDRISIPKEAPRITSEAIVIPNEEKNVAIYKPQPSKSKKTLMLTLQSNNNSESNTLKVNKRASREETHEYEIYCQLLAKKMKKLNEHQRDIVMHEIDEIMFRTKMQSGNEYKIEQRYPASSSPYTMNSQLIVVQNSTQYGDENMTYQDLDVQQQLSS